MKMTKEKMTTGETLLRALKDAGAKALFGIPGDYILPFFDVAAQSGILPVHTLSHEPAVGYAADAAARFGGGVGVAVVTYGAGALNMMNAVACAFVEKSPLVVISGAPGADEFKSGLLLHHQLTHVKSQLNMFREITCAQGVLDNPKTAAQEIARVLGECKRCSRPVYIELPRDTVKSPCKPAAPLKEKPVNEKAARNAAAAIVRRLKNARRPAILAGVEVRRFGLEEKLAALAEKAALPLATTLMGKGMFTHVAAPCLGAYIGAAGDDAIRKAVEESDALLIFGAIRSDTNFGAAGKKIAPRNAIYVNADELSVGGKKMPPADLARLLDLVLEKTPARREKRFSLFSRKTKPVAAPAPQFTDALLTADNVMDALRLLPQEGKEMPVAADIGDCLFMSAGIPDVPFLASGYYATMGFGVPAGLGVQAATGARPLIVTGDGGFQMTGWELLNCRMHGLDPVVLVLNNGGWGMLKRFSGDADYISRGAFSYAALARELGGEGYAARTGRELQTALQTALNRRGKFQLVEAVLSHNEVSAALKNYVSALRANKEGLRKKRA